MEIKDQSSGQAGQSQQESSSSTGSGVSTSDSKKNLAGNAASNVVFFVFSALTSLFFVPYQIAHLGLACYGMVVLGNSFVIYLQVLTVAIVGASGRFVTLEVARNKNEEARSYLTTQTIALVWLIGLLLPLCIAVSYFSPRLVETPAGQERNTQILFLLVFASFLVSLLLGVFRVAAFLKQRFDISNGIEMLNQVFRYGTWVVLFTVLVPSLWQIGLGYVIGAGVAFAATFVVFRRLTPQLMPRLRGFDSGKFREMTKIGGWLTVSQIGVILYLSIDALVINKMLGTASVGKYGTIMGLSMMLRGLGSMMGSMMMPIAIAYHAQQDYAGLLRTTVRALKFQSLAMAIPLGVICGLAVPFLTRWLGPEFGMLYPLVWLMLGSLVWNLAVIPLFGIMTALNRVAIPGVATVAGGLFHLGFAITLVKYTSLGIFGVAISGAICLSLKNVLFTPFYAGRILKISSWPLYLALLPSLVVFALTSAGGWGLTQVFELASFPRLLAAGAALFLLFGAIAFFGALGKDDRELVWKLTPFGKRSAAEV